MRAAFDDTLSGYTAICVMPKVATDLRAPCCKLYRVNNIFLYAARHRIVWVQRFVWRGVYNRSV
jgi:hypothetical protein